MALPALTFVFTFMAFLLSRFRCPQHFFKPSCGPCLGAPGCAACLYFRFHVHGILLSGYSCRQCLFQPPCGSCLAAPGCAAGLFFRFLVLAHSPFSLDLSQRFLRAPPTPSSLSSPNAT